jgi:hypothetical protein
MSVECDAQLASQLAYWSDTAFTGLIDIPGSTTDPYVTACSYSGIGSEVFGTDGGSFAIEGWEESSGVNPNKYFEISLSIQSEHKASLDTLTFTGRRDALGLSLYVRSSLDSFTANIGSKASLTTEVQSYHYALSGLSEVTGTVQFRFYGTDALLDDTQAPVLMGPGAGGTMISITGTTSPVPEPTSVALLSGLALFAFGTWRRLGR